MGDDGFTSNHLTGCQSLFWKDTYSSYICVWQAAHKWHTHISTAIENNEYSDTNSSKTIFMIRKGSNYIIHGLFVDDMMHIYSCDEMKDEFLALNKKDFEITGGRQRKHFLV